MLLELKMVIYICYTLGEQYMFFQAICENTPNNVKPAHSPTVQSYVVIWNFLCASLWIFFCGLSELMLLSVTLIISLINEKYVLKLLKLMKDLDFGSFHEIQGLCRFMDSAMNLIIIDRFHLQNLSL